MVMLSQQTILYISKMPIRTLNLRNPNNCNQTMAKSSMVYLLDPNLRARI
jgi:hypothetical protein